MKLPFILLISLLHFFSCPAQTNDKMMTNEEETEQKTRIAGTGIDILLPKTVTQDPNIISTYVQTRISEISGRIINSDYEGIKITVNWDFYKDRGNNKLVSEKPIKINGLKGNYLEITSSQVRSILISVGSQDRTYQIFGACHDLNNKAISELKSIFQTISIDTSFVPRWDDLAGFHLNTDYNDELKLQYSDINTYEFKSIKNLILKAMRIADIPNNRKESNAILKNQNLEGAEFRKGLIINNELTTKDTVINGYRTMLIEQKCKESSNEIELIQLLMEGKTKRILFTCKIRDNFDKNKALVYDFINHLKID